MHRFKSSGRRLRSTPAILLAVILPAALMGQAGGGDAAPEAGSLNLNVIAGNDAVNNLRRFTPAPTMIEIRDETGQPVGGATVTFVFPATGPSGQFSDGDRNFTATTDNNGRVSLPRFTPNRLAGSYQITVSATAGGRRGSTLIHETNAFNITPASSRHLGAGERVLIVLGVGAAIAAGSLLAIKGGNNSSGGSTGTPTSISIGVISVGAPH